MCRATIFLDRDGTLNEEVHYLHRPEDLKFLPTVIQAVGLWNRAGFRVVVVTNQAGVARGYYQEEAVKRLHCYINQCLAEHGAHIDQFYYCPHHPEQGMGKYKVRCHCRKPDTGMFEQAERDEAVDKSHSYMIGDKWIDIEAGFRFGINTALVGTGYGKELFAVYQKEYRNKESQVKSHIAEQGIAGQDIQESSAARQAKENLGYFGNTLLDIAEWILEKEKLRINE